MANEIKNKMRVLKILLVILFTQCSSRPDFYHGYVYDEQTKKPLKNVFVEVNYPLKPTHTNSDGYFKIENNTDSGTDLIFSLSGYEKDTAVTIWSQHGEWLMRRFSNKKPDTLFLRREN